jgi:hypothetical protein
MTKSTQRSAVLRRRVAQGVTLTASVSVRAAANHVEQAGDVLATVLESVRQALHALPAAPETPVQLRLPYGKGE